MSNSNPADLEECIGTANAPWPLTSRSTTETTTQEIPLRDTSAFVGPSAIAPTPVTEPPAAFVDTGPSQPNPNPPTPATVPATRPAIPPAYRPNGRRRRQGSIGACGWNYLTLLILLVPWVIAFAIAYVAVSRDNRPAGDDKTNDNHEHQPLYLIFLASVFEGCLLIIFLCICACSSSAKLFCLISAIILPGALGTGIAAVVKTRHMQDRDACSTPDYAPAECVIGLDAAYAAGSMRIIMLAIWLLIWRLGKHFGMYDL